MDENNQPVADSSSLESENTVTQNLAAPVANNDNITAIPTQAEVVSPNAPKQSDSKEKNRLWKLLASKLNIYTIMLIVTLAILAGLSYFAISQNRKDIQQGELSTQVLSQEALDKISGTDSSIGDSSKTLTIESNSIFKGSVLVRGGVDIAGTLKLGGPLSLSELNVGGQSTLDQIAAKTLTVTNDTSIRGKLSVLNGLVVTGNGSFSGSLTTSQLSTDKLTLNNDFQLNKHFVVLGNSPSRSNGTALGSGGTASNSGSDTSGTITINTGNSAPTGCFVTLTFANNYSSTPRVIVTPASSNAGSINYYTNRTNSGFSICSSTDPPDNTSGIIFDYFVVG